jgi:hypothetical protein
MSSCEAVVSGLAFWRLFFLPLRPPPLTCQTLLRPARLCTAHSYASPLSVTYSGLNSASSGLSAEDGQASLLTASLPNFSMCVPRL